jgi:hypothetical protein
MFFRLRSTLAEEIMRKSKSCAKHEEPDGP